MKSLPKKNLYKIIDTVIALLEVIKKDASAPTTGLVHMMVGLCYMLMFYNRVEKEEDTTTAFINAAVDIKKSTEHFMEETGEKLDLVG